MLVDLESAKVTIRILYAGPEGATKLVSLRGLQGSQEAGRRRDLAMLRTDKDRVVAFPFRPECGGRVAGLDVQFTAVAAPGRLNDRGAQRLLLMAADGLVFLPHRGEPGGPATQRAWAELMEDLAAIGRDPRSLPLVVQDYVDGEPRVDRSLLDGASALPQLVLVPVAGDTVEGVLSVFDAAQRMVLRKLAAAEEEGSMPSPPPAPVGAGPGTPGDRLGKVLGLLLILASVVGACAVALLS
jgi:hypothetical protein